MVLVQKSPFFQLSFLGNFSQENVFNDILERVNAFLGFEKKKFKKSKNWHISKRVNPCFWSRNGQKWPEKYLLQYSRTKNGFVGYKNMKFKKSKNDIFRKGISHGFGPKMPFFSILIFRRYRQGKYLWRYSRTKKRLSRL